MKAVLVVEWDLQEDADPADWHQALTEIHNALAGIVPRPVRAHLAIDEPAQAVLAAMKET